MNCFYLRKILDPPLREREREELGRERGRERGGEGEREILKSEKEILFSQRCVRRGMKTFGN